MGASGSQDGHCFARDRLLEAERQEIELKEGDLRLLLGRERWSVRAGAEETKRKADGEVAISLPWHFERAESRFESLKEGYDSFKLRERS